MTRSLSWRVGIGFVLLSLATWAAIGGALFLVLRALHADATSARLADLAPPLGAQIRLAAVGNEPRRALVELRSQVAGQSLILYLQLADGRIVRLAEDPAPPASLPITAAAPRGAVDRGTYRGPDGLTYAWAAFVLSGPNQPGPRALIIATPDRAGAEALRDLLAALPAVVLASLIVGAPIAWMLTRSIARPLRRLAAATADLPHGGAGPLPEEGPTEVREVTRHFNAMAAELTATRRNESEMLANLRHDLRTPVTVIGGFAAALTDGTATGPDVDRAARAIAQEAERLEQLVGELGAVERLHSGEHGLRPEPLVVAEVLAAAAERFVARAQAAGAEIAVLDRLEGLTVTADRQAVERMLANLIANAIAAIGELGSPSGATAGHVWLGARRLAQPGEPEAIVLEVTDDGPGFPPGSIHRVFERFYRADPARARASGGSGLGLAIVRDLARAHGGDAFAENVAPRGARVSVLLPVVARPPTAVEQGASAG